MKRTACGLSCVIGVGAAVTVHVAQAQNEHGGAAGRASDAASSATAASPPTNSSGATVPPLTAPVDPAAPARPATTTGEAADATPGSAPLRINLDEDEPVPRPQRKKREAPVTRSMDDSAPVEQEQQVSEPPVSSVSRRVASGFGFRDVRFVVGVERATSLLAWSNKATVNVPSVGSGFDTTAVVEESGTNVSFLGGPFDDGRNPFGAPRIGFDGVLPDGLTLGGSLTYLTSNGERSVSSATDGSTQTQTAPTLSVFTINPRIGVLLEASPVVAVWLRGGVTRTVLTGETSQSTSAAVAETTTGTVSLWNFSLDPQLVVMPVPHVGLTFGAVLDIGLSGQVERSVSGASSSTTTTVTNDYKASSYGITAGLCALF